MLRLIRDRNRIARDDRGNAMIGVIGLLAVTVVITLTITATTVSAVSFTSLTRAGVQSQAAAEAGVQAMISALSAEECPSAGSLEATYGEFDDSVTGSDANEPFFAVQLAHRQNPDQSWSEGCPIGATTEVRIVSEGFALEGGVSEASSGRDSSTVEAVYAWEVEEGETQSITPSGATMYSYGNMSNYNMSNFTLTPSPEGQAPSLQLKNGNFLCDSNSTINGSVEVGGGSMTVNGSCIVEGDVHTSGGVNMPSSGRVGGSVYAAGMLNGQYAYQMLNSSGRVDGSVIASGPVRVQGTVGGSVLGGPTTGTSYFQGSTRIGADVFLAGGLTANGAQACVWQNPCSESPGAAAALMSGPNVEGEVRYNQSAMTAPSPPTVPDWVDFDYDRSEWISDEDGLVFDEIVLSSGDCNWSWGGGPGIAKLRSALDSDRPVIVNALACTGGIGMYYTVNPELSSDLVIVARSFSMGSNTWRSSDSDELRRLWFITPDNGADGAPSCSGGAGNSELNSNVRVESSVAAMFYTPCDVRNSAAEWRGQMYARNAISTGGLILTYTPVGLPGVNLSTGSSDPSAGGGAGTGEQTVGELISFRDVLQSD